MAPFAENQRAAALLLQSRSDAELSQISKCHFGSMVRHASVYPYFKGGTVLVGGKAST